jgi:hypothetical protein
LYFMHLPIHAPWRLVWSLIWKVNSSTKWRQWRAERRQDIISFSCHSKYAGINCEVNDASLWSIKAFSPSIFVILQHKK